MEGLALDDLRRAVGEDGFSRGAGVEGDRRADAEAVLDGGGAAGFGDEGGGGGCGVVEGEADGLSTGLGEGLGRVGARSGMSQSGPRVAAQRRRSGPAAMRRSAVGTASPARQRCSAEPCCGGVIGGESAGEFDAGRDIGGFGDEDLEEALDASECGGVGARRVGGTLGGGAVACGVGDGVGGLADERDQAVELGVGGVVAKSGGGEGGDEAGCDLQGGGDAGREGDVLADADHVTGFSGDL